MTFVDKRARYNIKGLVIVRLVELDRGGGILYLHLRCCPSRNEYVNHISGANDGTKLAGHVQGVLINAQYPSSNLKD
jgi:hypothetical protein